MVPVDSLDWAGVLRLGQLGAKAKNVPNKCETKKYSQYTNLLVDF